MTDQSRIRLRYNDHLYSLGDPPESYDHLVTRIKVTIPDLANKRNLEISYIDAEGDSIVITTTYSLNEALACHEKLQLSVTSTRITKTLKQVKEPIFEVKLAEKRFGAMFTVAVQNRMVGMGIVVNERVALTTKRVIPDQDAAIKAQILFEMPGFPYYLSPGDLWVENEDVVFCAFAAPNALFFVEPVLINPRNVPAESGIGFTMQYSQDIKSLVRRIEFREILGDCIYFDSTEQCGPAGTAVFDEKWDFVGIQTTECTHNNDVIRCSALIELLKGHADYNVVKLILRDALAGIPANEALEYERCLKEVDFNLDTESCGRMFAVGGTQGSVVIYNDPIKNDVGTWVLEEKIGLGSSLCILPQGVFISGGKNALRQAWIYFFDAACSHFRIELASPHYQHTSVFYYNEIYIIGGRDVTGPISKCESFDYRKKRWRHIASLNERRANPGISVLHDSIYVFGGTNEHSCLYTIERYENAQWKFYPVQMPNALHSHGVINKDSDTVMFIGGRTEDTFNLKIQSLNLAINRASPAQSTEKKLGEIYACLPYYKNNCVYIYNL